MSAIEDELKQKRDEFSKYLIFFILGILIFYFALAVVLEQFFPYYQMVISKKLLSGYIILISLVSYMISKTEYNFFVLYKMVSLALFLLILHISMNVCHKSMTICIFYIPLLLMILILTNIKTTAIYTFLIIVLCIFTPTISELLDISHPSKSNPEYLKLLEFLKYVIILFSASLSILMLHYYNEFFKIELKYSKTLHPLFNNDTNEPITAEPVSEDKFELLYCQIINYLSEHKPYQNPEFNKRKLVEAIDSNETYVSKALSKYGRTFNSLVNEYRINQVRKEFEEGNYKKFTIEHIYSCAGFTQQSTFNRVFKEITGLTPTDFIAKVESNKSE